MIVKLYATLRQHVKGGAVTVNDNGYATIADILTEVVAQYPVLHDELYEDDRLHPSIHVFVNGRDVIYLNGLETEVKPTDSVRIFPPVGGGR